MTNTIIIIINIKDWTLRSVPSPELQLLAPMLLRSSNCSPSLWSVVVWFQRDSVLWHSLQIPTAVNTVKIILMADSKSVRNIYSSLPKQSWENVHLVGFYHKNISRCTVFWMSDLSSVTFDKTKKKTLIHGQLLTYFFLCFHLRMYLRGLYEHFRHTLYNLIQLTLCLI